eukprot:PITA_08843
MEAIRMFLAYACSRKIEVYLMDVKSTFLNGELEEEVYIEEIEYFLLTDKENYICRLKKALYALKQAPRAWYARFDRYLHQQAFKKGSADNNLYVEVDQDNLTIIEISQQYKGIFICQTKYIKEMLKKFQMEDCKPVLTPMITGSWISSKIPNNTKYHIIVLKRILQYLKGTTKYGLWYPKGNYLVIQAYTDADWAGSVDDRKSTSGATFYLGCCHVSWLSKKKSSVSLSTTEAEYITTSTCCTQVLLMKQTLQDLQVKLDEPIPIFCDNTNAISISKNPMMNSKTKHILIKYHFVRE